MPDSVESRQSLIEKRRELEARVETVRRDVAGGPDPDIEGQALPPENAEVLNDLLRNTLLELEEIERKLRGMSRK